MSECRVGDRPRRWAADEGQTLTEYVLLTGMIVSIWTLVFGPLGVSVQDTLRAVADRMIRVVAGG